MHVAKQKRKENIAEYILYMYQIEDLIRAFKLDMDLIQQKLIANYKVDNKGIDEIVNWYTNLVIMMDKEGIREKGHLQFLENLIADLADFHSKLIESGKEKEYAQRSLAIEPLLGELKLKNPTAKNNVDLGVTAIYGFLLLKMQQKEISAETTDAIKRISEWLSLLSKFYGEFENGKLEM